MTCAGNEASAEIFRSIPRQSPTERFPLGAVLGTSEAVKLALAALLVPTVAVAGGVGYAQATGYFKKDQRPTLYQPLNLLDARDVTAWCSSTSDPLNDQLTFGFKGSVKIDEVKVTTGNNFDEHTFSTFGRAKKLSLKGPVGGQAFTVADQRGPQSITFNPPLEGARFTLEILDQYGADDIDQPVCVTDIVFISEGKPLNGSWLTNKLKYDKQIQATMGTWFGGYPNNPNHFLSFFFDGTFRYSFEPFDDKMGKPKTVEGTYEVTASKLTFDVGGKKMSTRYVREAGKKGGAVLTFENDVPEDLKQAWRTVP